MSGLKVENGGIENMNEKGSNLSILIPFQKNG